MQSLPKGTLITVKVRKGKKLHGRLISVSTEGFTFQTLEGGHITENHITFDQVAKLSDELTSSRRKGGLWLIGGAAAANGVIVVIILAAIGAL
jgi:hypothetical protein